MGGSWAKCGVFPDLVPFARHKRPLTLIRQTLERKPVTIPENTQKRAVFILSTSISRYVTSHKGFQNTWQLTTQIPPPKIAWEKTCGTLFVKHKNSQCIMSPKAQPTKTRGDPQKPGTQGCWLLLGVNLNMHLSNLKHGKTKTAV